MSGLVDRVGLGDSVDVGSSRGATELRATATPTPPPSPRPIGRVSRDDVLTVFGAAVAALSMTALLFGRLTPLDGKVGFTVVAFAAYVAVYALLVSLADDGPAIVDKVMASVLTAAAVLAIAALVWVVTSTVWNGRKALSHLNFYHQDRSLTGPLSELDQGGIAHALVGTLIVIAIALVITVPLGITCAVYLNETRGRLTGLVRTIVTAMTALPSILAGLFILATWILLLGYPRSGLAAAIAISIMMLPIIIRSADVVLRLVPGSLREASAALGAPAWRTVWHVVLPTARSGLSTAVILGVARGIGETAPVLLTSGAAASMNFDPTANAMMSLPLEAFTLIRSPQETMISRGFGAAAVLMVVVLALFTVARLLGGRAAGHQSKRQARRSLARSRVDMARIESRTRPHPTGVAP